MLFHSYEFILFFLPVVLIGFFLIARYSKEGALIFLTGASALFVAWKNPAFLYLISYSICLNYLIFQGIIRSDRQRLKKGFFLVGVLFNIFYLFYFKYFNFTIHTLNIFFHFEGSIKDILLPLAISFYTFQQISYLHDTLNGKVGKVSFLKYCAFILFFPQLIAGPIIRHHEILPELSRDSFYKINFNNLALGTSLFTFGLLKKIVLADGAAKIVDPLYAAAALGESFAFFETWLGILAFSFQIYFDFSGYSDMAVGLGRLFNVTFPQNFHSPYKAESIIDFWRRWHISLSTFLRENLYIPLGGGEEGKCKKNYKSSHHDALRWAMAWGLMDLCGVGRLAWTLFERQSPLEKKEEHLGEISCD